MIGRARCWALPLAGGVLVLLVVLGVDRFRATRFASRFRRIEPRMDAVGPAQPSPVRESSTRFFADDFDRSPGHGLGLWEELAGEWGIEFSLDPNRIPRQYSLRGVAPEGAETALLQVDKPAWPAVGVAFSVSPTDGPARFGLALRGDSPGEDLRILFQPNAEGADTLRVVGPNVDEDTPLPVELLACQWYRVRAEFAASALRISLDGECVFESHRIPSFPARTALLVEEGTTFFDDVVVQERLAFSTAGDARPMPLRARPGSEWYGAVSEKARCALLGRKGVLQAGPFGEPIRWVVVEQDTSRAHWSPSDGGWRRRATASTDPAAGPTATLAPEVGVRKHGFGLAPDHNGEDVRVTRLAVVCGSDPPNSSRWGPYTFAKNQRQDPSDYLDFTDEEYERIRESPEESKLRREMKHRPVVGRGETAFWRFPSKGHWALRGGHLVGIGPNARLVHWRGTLCDLELEAKIGLGSAAAVAGIGLYGAPGDAPVLRIRATDAAATEEHALSESPVLRVPSLKQWHTVRLSAAGNQLQVFLNDELASSHTIRRTGAGDRVCLYVLHGSATFDDVEVRVARRAPHQFHYAFDRHETDWRRDGGDWIEHGGIACILASNWISLVAPEGRGLLWHKRAFPASRLWVATEVVANTEWFGWERDHSHRHHPYDNLCLILGTRRDFRSGYRLEVNADDRSRTVLYRNDEEVAGVAQDGDYPIRYRGGHAPYLPRSSRVLLTKNDSRIQATVNGTTVLSYDDPDPLETPHVGVGGYQTRFNIGQIDIRTAPRPEPAENGTSNASQQGASQP